MSLSCLSTTMSSICVSLLYYTVVWSFYIPLCRVFKEVCSKINIFVVLNDEGGLILSLI